MRQLVCILLLLLSTPANACEGKFLNPITEINWETLFPLKIGGITISAGSLPDTPGGALSPTCFCPLPTPPFIRMGISTGFWEPIRTVEVVRKPGCFPSLGGIDMGSVLGHSLPYGSRENNQGGDQKSFYHVHWIANPILYLLDFVVSSVCLQQDSMDVAYITELDPMWSDDELAIILNPEAALFGNMIAQTACAADCVISTAGISLNLLFWCAGCHGSLYPFTGTVTHHVGGVQASLLLTERMIAKLSRMGLTLNTSSAISQCFPMPSPIIKKDQYRIQMMRPIRQTIIPALPFGRTDVIISSGKEFPVKGEDFVYQIWRKRECCAF
ncbi:MAG: conjugal transfer pilus assembly protein TraU [Mariprofundales bacterium]